MEKTSAPQFSEALRPEEGVYLAHKPRGATSFSLVQAFAARLAAVPGKRLKVCHGGVLDPFASGLLLVLVGPVTRLFELLHEVPKSYLARVAWGQETDTGDGGGQVVREAAAPTPEAREAALRGLLGWSEQRPPATSNKRLGGERAYRRAHRGEAVELPLSKVYLHSARWRGADQLELTCRGGFYVRALVRDVARAVGSAAHLVELERTQIGPWLDPGEGSERRLIGEELLPWLPSRPLSDDDWGRLRREEALSRGDVNPPSWPLPEGFPAPRPWVRALHQGRLVGMLAGEEHFSLAVRLH